MPRTHALLVVLLLVPCAGAFAADASAPAGVDIDQEKAEPGQAEWAGALDALAQGESLIFQARQFGPRDPDFKHQAYTRAETCLKASLGWIDAYLVIRPDPQPVVEETVGRIHRDLYECHKSKPLLIG